MKITGLDVFELVAALHNGTRPLGMGVFNARGPMTATEVRAEDPDRAARTKTRDGIYFDYYHGRPLKTRIVADGDALTVPGTWLYDRDAGDGAFVRAVTSAGGTIVEDVAADAAGGE